MCVHDLRVCSLIYRGVLRIIITNGFPRFLGNSLRFIMILCTLWNLSLGITESGFNALVIVLASVTSLSTVSDLGFWTLWIWGLDGLSMTFGPLDLVWNSALNLGSEVITSDVEFLQVHKLPILSLDNELLHCIQSDLSLRMCPFLSDIGHVASHIFLLDRITWEWGLNRVFKIILKKFQMDSYLKLYKLGVRKQFVKDRE